jgi:hypothetical protein
VSRNALCQLPNVYFRGAGERKSEGGPDFGTSGLSMLKSEGRALIQVAEGCWIKLLRSIHLEGGEKAAAAACGGSATAFF